MVNDCTSCMSTEFCVNDVFQGDNCMETDAGTDCPAATSSYSCWPIPPGCSSPITCECAAYAVSQTCGQDGSSLEDDACSPMAGGISCEEPTG
jgi:hypothetical protein